MVPASAPARRQRALARALALAAAAALLLPACVTVPIDAPRTPSTAVTDTADTLLGQVAARAAGDGESGVRLLARGLDAFVARLVLAEVAERSLDLQYYIWHDDTTGWLLTAALLHAADRGVRVRLILDDIGTAPDDARLALLDSHPNIEVRLFNPIALRSARMLGLVLSFERSNRRMHNKSMTADNQATIVGGRNIGDEYFEARPDLDFGDLDVLAVGPVVGEVSASFDRYWNSTITVPIGAIHPAGLDAGENARRLDAARSTLQQFVGSQRAAAYAQALRNSGLTQQMKAGTLRFAPARARVLADDPGKVLEEPADTSTHLVPQMLPEFESLTRDLFLVSPYFVPGEAGVAGLARLRARDVRVRVLTNSLAATDVPAVHAGYARYRPPLLAAGVELYEVKASARRDAHGAAPEAARSTTSVRGSSRASLHAKTLVFDCRQVFIGSMNVDPRSVFTNTEIGIMIDAPDLGATLCAQLDAAVPAAAYRIEQRPDAHGRARLEWVSRDGGSETRTSTEPGGGWRSFQAWFFSLLPIEPLL